MTKKEFAAVMIYIGDGCGKKLSQEGLRVYWDLLSDVPLDVLQVAAKRSLLENTYAVFPQVGTLRKLSAEAMGGASSCLPAVEAWGLVRKAMCRYGYARGEAALQSLPPMVRRCVECMGWNELCEAEITEVVRSQFVKSYETMLHREERERLLPENVTALLATIGGEKQLTSSKSAG